MHTKEKTVPTRNADASSVAKFLLKIMVTKFGAPEKINSDQGSHFTSQVLKRLYETLIINQQLREGVRRILSSGDRALTALN